MVIGVIFILRMILLKDILLEAKLYSYSTEELLEKFLEFDGKTLIFLDTETTGIDPNKFYVQLTHVAAMAVEGSTWDVKDTLSIKVELNPVLLAILNSPSSNDAAAYEKENQRHIAKYKKPETHPRDLLDKTQYFKTSPGEQKMSEKDALIEVEEFIERYPSVVIVAHNAGFDMKVIQTRRRENGLPPMKRVPVLDTVAVARFFFIPALVSLKDNPEAQAFLEKILAKTKYRSYGTDLGKLAKAFEITSDNWHDASADTQMMFEILKKIIDFLKQHSDLDIIKYNGTQAKRFRRMRV